MHPSDWFARTTFDCVVMGVLAFDRAVDLVNEHSIGARSRFYRLVDEYTS